MHRSSAIARIALAALIVSLLGLACGGLGPPTGHVASDAAPDATPDAARDAGPPVAADAPTFDSPACPASCDDGNPCTSDRCDPATFACVHDPVADGTACPGKPCTTNSVCQAGLCLDGPFIKCTASDQCHVAGTCNPATGACTNPNATNGTHCNDQQNCTYADVCTNGVCIGTPVVCRGAIVCEPSTGTCPGSFPTALLGQSAENIELPSGGSGILRAGDGSVFAAGSFYDQVDLGAGTITPYAKGVSSADLFLARLDPATTRALWTQTFPGPKRQSVIAFGVSGPPAPGAAFRLGVIGSLEGEITVQDNAVDALYKGDQFILGASATDGSGLWVWRYNLYNPSTRSSDRRNVGLEAIAGDPSGSAFTVCGTVACGGVAVDGGVAPNPASVFGATDSCQGGLDVVVARVDGETGRPLWGRQVGGTNDEDCDALAIDEQGSVYVAGTYRFGSALTFGALPALPVVGEAGAAAWMFLAKLDAKGTAVWARAFGRGKDTIAPTAMIVAGGDVLLAGTTSANALGTADVAGSDLGAPTFIARFDASGIEKWAVGLGAGGGLRVSSLSESGGRILVAGSYAAAATIVTAGAAVALPAPSTLGGGAFVVQIDGVTGAALAAKGYGDSRYASTADGIVARTDGTGDEAGTSLLLLSFSGSLDLGSPAGALQASAVTAAATGFAKLAP